MTLSYAWRDNHAPGTCTLLTQRPHGRTTATVAVALSFRRRAEDDAATIQKRLASAAKEIPHWRDFDYVLVNDDLDRSFARLQAILAAERLKRTRSDEPIGRLVDGLMAELAHTKVPGA